MQMSLSHLSNPSLWARIAGAHLPVERDGGSFADHLAEIAGLTPGCARLLEREYRRFLYLAALGSWPRVPPGLVRIAWSYHAEHDGYAREFSEVVLGRSLPFTPTPHSSTGAYAATVRAYGREFGEGPPASIWPDASASASLPHWHGSDVAPQPLHA